MQFVAPLEPARQHWKVCEAARNRHLTPRAASSWRFWGIARLGLAVTALFAVAPSAQTADSNSPTQLLTTGLTRLMAVFEPAADAPPRTFTARLKILKSGATPEALADREFDLALQAPDRLRVSTEWRQESLTVGRNGQELWYHCPAKKFGLIGKSDVPKFSTDRTSLDTTPLGPLKLPAPYHQIILLPLLSDVEALPEETVGTNRCQVLKATPKAEAVTQLNLPRGHFRFWLRAGDAFPLRLAYHEGGTARFELELIQPQWADAWPADRWKLPRGADDKIESVARAHLTRFLAVTLGSLGEKIPTLGPAKGERRVLAREGRGRLEDVDGTRVLFLKGSPEEMGRQHGTLLKKSVRHLVDRLLYGVGVGSSFERGSWVFGEIEAAQKRLLPFMDARYLREMDALADAAGLPREEVRLANFFPEMFHCSGFALFGRATVEGRLYHGRILDYIRGFGLEQNAVVMVLQPDDGRAWVNVGYAGFIGTVTAMNEKRVAIGEMGGAGQGKWDGKPMAHLLREVMEKADTLDEAVEIMRKGPRTCEYYYVISDAKTKQAVGIAATPETFEIILPGRPHPRLAHAIPDAVLMSAGDRYEELARRVQAQHGKLDAAGARELMKRPVCMTSNIHSALFAPDTLDFWVANADSVNVAAHARFTHYNLAELLQPEKTP